MEKRRLRGWVDGCSARAEMRPPCSLTRGGRCRLRPSMRVLLTCRRGLLRPRGDAPTSRPLCILVSPAAPPARRSADPGLAPLGALRRLGCSARAEMRRSPCAAASTRGWLLRPRGDAPSDAGASLMPAQAAPPARRCAPVVVSARVGALGCSARAEMRPRRTASSRARAGLLRPRGDAPRTPITFDTVTVAAPPARRCAPADHRPVGRGGGCSARAEMRRSPIGARPVT